MIEWGKNAHSHIAIHVYEYIYVYIRISFVYNYVDGISPVLNGSMDCK